MRRRWFWCTIVSSLAVLALMPAAALTASVAEAAPTTINVRIEGRSETIFEGPVLTEGHDIKASSDTQERPCDGTNNAQHPLPGPTPTAASVDAMSIIGETFDGQWYPGFDDYFITRWGPDEQDPAEAAYWGLLVNDVFTNVGGCQYELHENDEVLWVYDAFEDRPTLALFPAGDTDSRPPLTAIAQLGQPFEVQVDQYSDNTEDNPPAQPDREDATPYEGAEVSPVETNAKGFEKVLTSSPATVTTNAQGKAIITFTTSGWHRIKAGAPLFKEDEEAEAKEEAIRSNRIDICVPAQGATGCGSPPAEDDVRTPPARALAPEDEDHETPAATSNTGNQSGSGSGATTPLTSTPAPVQQGGPVTLLALESATSKRLLLKLAAPGAATVQIARQIGSKHHLRWRVVKTIIVKAARAGEVAVKLPGLPAGRYRLRISLAGARTLVKTLTVPSRRR
jgi:Domain of unknown function (DUF4430)